MTPRNPEIRPLIPIDKPVTEADAQRRIREYLERDLGLVVHRANAAASRGRRAGGSAGLPDLFGVLPGGRLWGVEVKRLGSRPRPNEAAQQSVLNHWRECGALVCVARTVLEVRAAFEAAGS